MTTLREEPVATGGLSFCQILLPLPHSSPVLLNWVREGREWREVRPVPLIAPLPLFLFVLFFLSFPFFLMNSRIISLFATAAHTILLSPLPHPILAIYHYEMERVFNFLSQNHRRIHTHTRHQLTSRQII